MAKWVHRLKKHSGAVSESVGRAYERLTDQRLGIGVTGFSRSGKTTLITSLIYQLLHHDNAALAAFSPAVQGQLLGAQLQPLVATDAMFPYSAGIEQLASLPPVWPQATREESSCLLELRLKPREKLLRIGGSAFRPVYLEVHDYPGEWLMDIPMLGMNFQQWSHQWQGLLNEKERAALSVEYKNRLSAIDPLKPLSAAETKEVFTVFQNMMNLCREQGLTLVQPGQLCLEWGEDHTIAPFFPLLDKASLDSNRVESAPEHCLVKQLARRYRQYVEEQVTPFAERCLQGVDRQIVLIDVVGALAKGEGALKDLQQSLVQVLQTFSYGKNTFISRLLKPKIEKLLIVSTKVDQVLPGQHDGVRQLTSTLVKEAYRRATFCNIPVRCEAIASVRSSSVVCRQGHERLTGRTVDGEYGEMWHPEIPDTLPEHADWRRLAGWSPRPLLPPDHLNLAQGGRLPHIRLDVLIDHLIGDVCQ